jgi:hypothetical protein
MAAAPDRAPSVSRSDVKTAAVRFAAILDPDAQDAVERASRSLASLAELAEVVGQEGALVEQAAAFTGLRQLADGLAQRSRALKLLGNGVLPLAAAHAFRTLAAAHGLGPVDLEAASGDDAT